MSSTRGTSHRSQHGRLVVRPRLPQDADSRPHAFLFAWQPANFPERHAQGPGTTVRPPAAVSAAGTPSSVVLAVSVGRPSHARRQGRVQPPRHSPDADETTPVAPRSQRADVGVPHGIPWSSGHFLNQLPEGRADGARGEGLRPGKPHGDLGHGDLRLGNLGHGARRHTALSETAQHPPPPAFILEPLGDFTHGLSPGLAHGEGAGSGASAGLSTLQGRLTPDLRPPVIRSPRSPGSMGGSWALP